MHIQGQILGHIPVIGVTANARGSQIDQATKAGMDDVISKPFHVSDLMVRITGLLKRLRDAP